MSTITIQVTTQEGSNQFNETLTLDLEDLRKTPNPRQAAVSHFLSLANKAIAEVDPSFTI